ncbi:MAG: hypothetical protein COZ74_04345 [Flavobacteriaceae bacterium CG_4_8_14_3_um_filter_31_8]|nr:MAG: hypothetical protein COZ74_04345 [Flavobacteriaceae bacterium CG_4_8_14_3_um_filter_31_8]
MKKIITIILCFFFIKTSYSQTQQHVVDSLFQYINKSPISSNIFIERVFSSSGITEFNQGVRIDTSSFIHFKQSWSDLNRASYTQTFKTIAQFKSDLKNKNYQDNVVPIGVINTEFHQSNLGTSISTANVNYSNGFMRDKAGKNPFLKKQATVIAPLVASARGNQITFKLDAAFMLYKFGKPIKNLVLQTNNSSFTLINNTAISNSNFTTSYNSSGIKILKFMVTFSDNTTKTTYGKVKIFVPNTYNARGLTSALDTISSASDLQYQGYDESIAYQGQNEYRIYYDNINGNQIINKPIFILDGYDPGDVRKIETFDAGHDSPKSIVELMSFIRNNNPTDLIDELRNDGYDVIIVNHIKYTSNGKQIDGGSDYIQRNAYTFISLLRYINSIKQGNEPNVVIGPSMGGLITRYALAYMEQQLTLTGDNAKWNHDTRLWVSFDSPHQGAHIPFVVQKGIQYYAEKVENEGAKDFIKELDQPAPKQMLINHYSNNTQSTSGAPNFRNQFQNELDNLGMPQNLRKIALINGSITGVLNGISKDKYLQITSVPFLYVVFSGADIKVMTDYYHSSNEKNNSSSEVFFGRHQIKYSVFGLFTITKTFKKSQIYLNANLKGSYDISPGGYFNAQQQLAQESSGIDLGNGIVITNSNLIDPTHSFIPSKSALAYTGNAILDEVIGNKDRVCSGETPFDSYFAPENNEEHITLTAKNVDWLKAELDVNITNLPPTVYKDLDIITLSGDLAVCDTKTNIYNLDIPNTCSGFTITWTTSSNIQIQQSSNNSLTVTPINGTNDAIGFINAYVQELNLNIHKKVWVGIPSPNFLSINKVGSYEFYANQWTKLKVVHPVPPLELMGNDPTYGLSYQWLVPNSQIRTFTDTSTIDVNPYNTGQLNIGVKMQNQCGCKNYQYQLFNVSSSSTTNPGGGGILTPIGKM